MFVYIAVKINPIVCKLLQYFLYSTFGRMGASILWNLPQKYPSYYYPAWSVTLFSYVVNDWIKSVCRIFRNDLINYSIFSITIEHLFSVSHRIKKNYISKSIADCDFAFLDETGTPVQVSNQTGYTNYCPSDSKWPGICAASFCVENIYAFTPSAPPVPSKTFELYAPYLINSKI